VARVRPVYFDESGDFVRCAIYDRYALEAGLRLEGPAIVEELDSTCVLHPGYAATVDDFGNLLLTEAGAQVPGRVSGGSRAHA
jgi:N-methylhydantoinase A